MKAFSLVMFIAVLIALFCPSANAGLIKGAAKGIGVGIGGVGKGVKTCAGCAGKGVKCTFGGIGKAFKTIL